MTTRRRIGLAVAALVVVSIAAGIGRSAWRRAQEPKYEGRTAGEWLDQLSANGYAAFLSNGFAKTEAEVAFLNLGASGERYLVGEYLRFEQSKGFRLQFQTLSKRIPDRLRPRFLSSPTDRWIVCGAILRTIRPDWEVLTPEVLEAFATSETSVLRATSLLGWTGRGATNATLLLMQHPTNSAMNYHKFWRQAFDDLGTNTYPALLELIQRLDSGSADAWLLNNISRHGAAASGALPKLNQLFGAALSGTTAKHNFAVALLRIEPNHEGAANHIRDELRSTLRARLTGPTLSLLMNDFPPDTKASELVKAEAEVDGNWYSLAQTLLRTDEPAGIAFLHERIVENFNSDIRNALQLLLTHNPNETRALGYLRSQVDNEFFPRNHFRLSIVTSHRHCLPDSPGVVELLKSIQPAPDDEALRKVIRETLRHIELNGKLKELRERDDARQR